MASSELNSAQPVAFQVHANDNVATLLDTAAPGPVTIHGCGSDRTIVALKAMEAGHKIASACIPCGAAVIKYGEVIGIATAPVETGAWVHLHNCKSQMDERSGTFDLHTGRPEDTRYE